MSVDQQQNISHFPSSHLSKNMPETVASSSSATTESEATPSCKNVTSEGCSPNEVLVKSFEIDSDLINELLNYNSLTDCECVNTAIWPSTPNSSAIATSEPSRGMQVPKLFNH